MRKLRLKDARLITTDLVSFEFLNALSSVKHRSKAIAFVDTLQNLTNVEIISLTSETLEKSLKLYRDRTDKNWSLTDC